MTWRPRRRSVLRGLALTTVGGFAGCSDQPAGQTETDPGTDSTENEKQTTASGTPDTPRRQPGL